MLEEHLEGLRAPMSWSKQGQLHLNCSHMSHRLIALKISEVFGLQMRLQFIVP
jgi:hypothetical protein